MRNVIIFIGILFSSLLNSQVKLNNKSIDSIVTKNKISCYEFFFDKENSYIELEELTEDEGYIPTKLKIFLSDNKQLDELINNKKEYGYFVVYNYQFTINNYVFYTSNFRYDTSQYDNSIIKAKIENINSFCLKIKKRKFISPKKAENIARNKGLYNIFFQSIDDHYYDLKDGLIKSVEKDVWIFKENRNNKTRVVIIDAKNGKLLKDYYQ